MTADRIWQAATEFHHEIMRLHETVAELQRLIAALAWQAGGEVTVLANTMLEMPPTVELATRTELPDLVIAVVPPPSKEGDTSCRNRP